MPRLFTGIELPEAVTDELAMMAGGIPGARWISKENYHITLRFIGDVDDAQAEDLAEMLADTAGCAFSLSLKGVGNFGTRKPRSIHALVEPNSDLTELHARQERVCQMVGLEPEGRNFIPHITLARLKQGVAIGDVKNYLAHYSPYRSASFDVARFVLYSSKPSSGGGPYVVEQAYELS